MTTWLIFWWVFVLQGKSLILFVSPDTGQCAERSFITKPIVNCIPAWIRFAQCLRRYRDSKEAFPHLVNAGKYSTTFFVVIFSTLRAYHASECLWFISVCKCMGWSFSHWFNFFVCLFLQAATRILLTILTSIHGCWHALLTHATRTPGTWKWIGAFLTPCKGIISFWEMKLCILQM